VALSADVEHVAFVRSKKKAEAQRATLVSRPNA